MTYAKTVCSKTEPGDLLAKSLASDNASTVNYVTVGCLPESAQDGGACGSVRAAHWSRQPSIVAQFWRHVHKTDGCWWWTGTRNQYRGGYGSITLGHPHGENSITWAAHRFSYELHSGRIPRGKVVCHRCDNPSCVRPDHLFLGSQRDNLRDASLKGRLKVARPARRKVSDDDIARMRQLRADGWRQAAIAEQFGVTPSFVAMVLAGKRRAAVLPMPERRYSARLSRSRQPQRAHLPEQI